METKMLFVKLVCALRTGMTVSDNLRELSNPFEVRNAMKQGCVLDPTPFPIILSIVLSDVYTDSTQGIWIQSRLEVNLFDASQFKSAIKTRNILVRVLIFNEDTTFVAHNHQNVQEINTRLLKSIKRLKINLRENEVMHRSPLSSHDIGQDIQIEDRVLTQVNKSKYIGYTVANSNRIDAELDTRTSNASNAFGELMKRAWLCKDLSIKT